MKLTIEKKLMVIVGILLVLFLILGVTAYIQIRRVDKGLKDIADVKEPTSSAAYEMEMALRKTGLDLLGYLHDRSKNRLKEIEQDIKAFEEYQKRYRELADTEEGRAFGASVDDNYNRFKEIANELIGIENIQTEKMVSLFIYFGETDKILDERIQNSIRPDEPDAFLMLQTTMEMEIATNGIAKSLGNYLRTHNSQYEKRVRKDEDYFNTALAAYKKLALSHQEMEWARRIEQLFDNSVGLIKEIIQLDREKEGGLAKLADIGGEMGTLLNDKVRVLTRRDLKMAEDESRRITMTAAVAILVLIFAGVIAGLVSSTVIARSITWPITKLKGAAAEIGEGRLDTPIDIRSGDEIGELAASFGKMAKDLQKTQGVLIQTEKLSALGDLGAGVAHELNNPLTGVMSMVKAYMKGKDEGSEEYNDLKIIDEACRHMAKIIADFTAFTRPSGEEQAEVNCNEIIKSVLTFAMHPLKKRDISVVQNLDPNLPAVKGNKNQLQQVVVNLLSNARDAIFEKGTITITTRSNACDKPIFVEMEFSDTGCGIDKKDLSKIFDPFYTTKRPGKGIGLGLSVVHTIISAHNGEILVNSEAGKKGASFTIRLPTFGVRLE